MIKPINNRRKLLVLATALTAITAIAITVPAAQATGQNTTATDGSGYTVEPVGDPFEAAYTIEPGTYPGADKIAAQKQILLKDGDGQIIYTQCTGAPDQIQITGSVRPDVCFQPLGPSGWLRMEITDSFGVKAGAKSLDVKSIDEGKEKTTEIPATEFIPVMNKTNSKDVTVIEISIKGTQK